MLGVLLLETSPNWDEVLAFPTLALMAARPQGTCSQALVASKERGKRPGHQC